MLDDRARRRWANAGQLIEFGDGRAVDIDEARGRGSRGGRAGLMTRRIRGQRLTSARYHQLFAIDQLQREIHRARVSVTRQPTCRANGVVAPRPGRQFVDPRLDHRANDMHHDETRGSSGDGGVADT